jgi:hypothetical protein
MPTAIETRAAEVLAEMQQRLSALGGQSARVEDFSNLDLTAANDRSEPVACAGNQHTCQPQFFIPSTNQRFDMVLEGNADSVIVGHHNGPRALLWENTELSGEHPELGKVSVRLEPSEVNAGTLVPALTNTPFPAVNRNTYFFVFNIDSLGELISDRPAIVEALIDDVPPQGTYVFRNGPLNFHLRSDPSKTTVVVLEAAVTDVQPKP